MTQTNLSHTPRPLLALPTHLLEFLQASHRSPPRKAALLKLLHKDAALLANLLTASQPVVGMTLSDADTDALSVWLDSLSADTLQQMALTAATPWFTAPPDDATLLALRQIHTQSTTMALLAHELALLAHPPSAQEATLAGQLHNLGKLVLLSEHPAEFIRAALPAQASASCLQAERDALDKHHLDAAAERMQAWQLDSFIVDAALYQYDELQGDADVPDLITLLQAARTVPAHEESPAMPALLAHRGISDSHWHAALSRWRKACSKLAWLTQDDELFCAVQREALHAMHGWLADQAALQSRQLALYRCTDLTTLMQAAADMLREQHALEALFFLVSEDQRQLRGQPLPGQPQRLTQLQARIESGTSLVAQALVSDELLDSFSAENFALGILDRQLLQLIRGDGYCCVPLRCDGRALGTLVLGMANSDALTQVEQPAMEALLASLGECLLTLQQHQQRSGQSQDSALLAREIYHEVSSPVSAIRNYLYVLKRDASDSTRELLQQVEAESARISEILLTFRQRALNEMHTNELLDINALIRETASRVVRQQHYQGQLEISLDSQTPRLHSNRTALQQVLANLLCNAMEAVGDDGHIQIQCRGGWLFNQQRYLSLEIRDNGGGIPAAVQQKLFQPVASTKGGQHAGLGLSIVSKLITELNGLISVHSDSSGTCFQILLPDTSRP